MMNLRFNCSSLSITLADHFSHGILMKKKRKEKKWIRKKPTTRMKKKHNDENLVIDYILSWLL